MIDKEKIKAEIERLKEKGYPINTFEGSAGYNDALDEVLNFIDSLPEEPVSEELEEAAYNYVMNNYGNPKESSFLFEQRCFKAGAEWQKKQYIKQSSETLQDEPCDDKNLFHKRLIREWNGGYDCGYDEAKKDLEKEKIDYFVQGKYSTIKKAVEWIRRLIEGNTITDVKLLEENFKKYMEESI